MNILILCDKFLPISEQFIYNQIRCLDNHNLFLFARKTINRELYDSHFKKELIWYNNPAHRLLYKIMKEKEQYPNHIQKLLQNFIKVNNIDIIYIHYGTTATAYQNTINKIAIPVICAFHGFDASRKLNDPIYRDAIHTLEKSIFHFTAPSDYLVDKLNKAGVPANKITKIQYGTDIEKIDQVLPENDNLNRKITIIHAGRIVAKKGVPDLVKVFLKLAKNHADLHLKIVGGGEEETVVRQIINSSILGQKVEMTGPLNHLELIKAVKSADIFVLNSRETESGETEGLPNSIMEAMTCNTCIVSTKHSGIPELLTNNVNGILIDPKNNDQLEEALNTLIQDKDLRLRLQTEARKTVENYFSLNHMNKLINELVTSVDI